MSSSPISSSKDTVHVLQLDNEISNNTDAVIASISQKIFNELGRFLMLVGAPQQVLDIVNKVQHLPSLSSASKSPFSLEKIFEEAVSKEEIKRISSLVTDCSAHRYLSVSKVLSLKICQALDAIGDKLKAVKGMKYAPALEALEGQKCALKKAFVQLDDYLKTSALLQIEMRENPSAIARCMQILASSHFQKPSLVRQALQGCLKLCAVLQAIPELRQSAKKEKINYVAIFEDGIRIMAALCQKPEALSQLARLPSSSIQEMTFQAFGSCGDLIALCDFLEHLAEGYPTIIDAKGFAFSLKKDLMELDKHIQQNSSEKVVLKQKVKIISVLHCFLEKIMPLFMDTVLGPVAEIIDQTPDDMGQKLAYHNGFLQMFSLCIAVLEGVSARYGLHYTETLFTANCLLDKLSNLSSERKILDCSHGASSISAVLFRLSTSSLLKTSDPDIAIVLATHYNSMFPHIPLEQAKALMAAVHVSAAADLALQRPCSKAGLAKRDDLLFASSHHKVFSFVMLGRVFSKIENFSRERLRAMERAKIEIEAILKGMPAESKTKDLEEEIQRLAYDYLHHDLIACTLRAELYPVFVARTPSLEEFFPDELLELLSFEIPIDSKRSTATKDPDQESEENSSIAQKISSSVEIPESSAALEDRPLADIAQSDPPLPSKELSKVKDREKSEEKKSFSAVQNRSNAKPMQAVAAKAKENAQEEELSLKSLRKFRQIFSLVQRLGYRVIRTSGSHFIMRDESGRQLVIPRHDKDIKKGTLHAIIDAL